jgi:hypothetical protein
MPGALIVDVIRTPIGWDCGALRRGRGQAMIVERIN